MKASITLSLLILALGGFCGWRQSERLDVIRETHRQVAAEVRALGLSPETIGTLGQRALRSKREREEATNKTAEAKAVAGELIDWKKSMLAGHTTPDRERGEELMDQLEGLTPSQIEAVIAEIRASGDLDDKARNHVAQLSLSMLGRNHPQAALELFIDSSDVVSMAGSGQHVISTTLGKWAEENPAGALEWLRQNGEKRPELMTDRTKSSIISGTAKLDPKFALSLIGELKLEDNRQISLAAAVRTPEERTALLAALRDFKNDDGDLLKKTLGSMAYYVAGNDFEASQAWLSSAKLTEQEMKHFTEGLRYHYTQGDTGHWIGWMADNLPADQLPQKVGKIVWEWAEGDYKAAGEWINGSPDGPVKQAAVKGYAGALAPHQPDSAAQWALTLPEGKERDKLLRIVHAEWRKKDPAAAAEFARAQGLGM